MPLLSFITCCFQARRFAGDHSPIWSFWITDGEEATLINPASGRVHAYVWHDGCGKYHPTIILPLRRVLPSIWKGEGVVVSLLPFPRVRCIRRYAKQNCAGNIAAHSTERPPT
jgi:hypothetical protein